MRNQFAIKVLGLVLVLVGAGILFIRFEQGQDTSGARLFPEESQTVGEKTPPVPGQQLLREGNSRESLMVAAEGDAPQPGLRIQVSGRGHAPVEGVQVYVERGAEVMCSGSTDGTGRLSLYLCAPLTLWLRHDGYVTTSLEIEQLPVEELRVHLESDAALRGRVQTIDGSPLPEGARVTALPSYDHSPHGALGSPETSNPRLAVANVDETGHFELGGLREGQHYVVRAAAPGWLSTDRVLDAIPGKSDLELTLRPLYAFRQKLLVDAGSVPQTGLDAIVLGGMLFEPFVEELELISDRVDDLQLAGLNVPVQESWLERLNVFVGDTVAERAGPVVLHVHIYGYHPLVQNIWPRRVGLEEIETVELRLLPMALEWGAVNVQYDRELPQPLKGAAAEGTLDLIAEDGTVIQLGLRPNGTYELPIGTYRWRFQSPGKLHVYPHPGDEWATVRISNDEVAEILIEWGEAGSAIFELVRADGRLHRGQAIFRFSKGAIGGRPSGFKHLKFSGAPYVLRGLRAGLQEVTAITGTEFSSPGSEDYHGTVEVIAGELVEAVLFER